MILDYFDVPFQSTTSVHSLLGIVLGLFLVFRMNSAYDRWWEGRVSWGTLVNASRNFAVKLESLLDEHDVDNRKFFSTWIPGYAFALKEHLRDGVKIEDLELSHPEYHDELRKADNVPTKITSVIYKRINALVKSGQISGEELLVLNKEASVLTDIVGSCERIKNTPIPYSYSMYLKKFIFTYSITLPLGFVTSFGYWTVPIVLFLFFILVSIELIAEEIEDPFGRDVNDLPTDTISSKIRAGIQEVITMPSSEPVLTVEGKE